MFTQDLEQKESGGFIQKAATITAVFISALASFQFFATYSGGLLVGIVPAEFLSIAAGILGIVMLEGATMYWQYSVQNDADSKKQLDIAKAGYMVSLIISVTVTALYFMLTSSLIAPYVGQIMHIVNAFAALVLVGIVSFQFVAKTSYNHEATKASQAKHDASLRALHNAATFQILDASTRADLENALAEMQKRLPEVSRKRGIEGAGQFINERYGQNGRLQPQNDPVNVPNGNGPA